MTDTTQADKDAALRWGTGPVYNMDHLAQAFAAHAKAAADQRQSEIVAWLREFDNHPPTPNCPRCNAADAIESGAWMADRTNGGIG
jgi:hypothetical protein